MKLEYISLLSKSPAYELGQSLFKSDLDVKLLNDLGGTLRFMLFGG